MHMPSCMNRDLVPEKNISCCALSPPRPFPPPTREKIKATRGPNTCTQTGGFLYTTRPSSSNPARSPSPALPLA